METLIFLDVQGQLTRYSVVGSGRNSKLSSIRASHIASVHGTSSANFLPPQLPPRVGGTIFCSRRLGHMPKMAATPIYSKNPSKSSSPEPAGGFSRNLVCSIGDSSPS